jgi:hypothetical protein
MNVSRADNTDWITGTWMAVSHQTVQIIHYREDGTFSGTYFTPGLDVKSVMEGTWRLDEDILHTTWLKSDLPGMSTPWHDKDRVKQLDPNRMQVTGLNVPIQLVLERVEFKKPQDVILKVSPVKREPSPPVPAPTVDELRAFNENDMEENNLLLNHIFALIEHAPGEFFHDRVRHVVDTQLTEAAGFYYVTEMFYRMYGNGGMQDVLLIDDEFIEFELWQLRKVRDGFRYFGCKGQADFMESQMKNVVIWAREITRLIGLEREGVEVPESGFETVWHQIDALEPTWERIRDKDPFLYDQVLKDLKANPERYLRERLPKSK